MERTHQTAAELSGRATYRTLSASSVGIEIAVAIALGVLGGRWLDAHFGTTPWLFYLGTITGCAAAGRALRRVAKALDAADHHADRGRGAP